MSKENNIVFANNLTYYMNKNKVDRKKLCDDLGFKYSTVSEWISGKKYPRMDKIEALSIYFGIQKSDLIEENNVNSIKNSLPYTPENMVPIPVIGRVAAGYTCLADTDIECYELVSPENINDGYDYVYLKVIGNSMEPLIIEGDLVLVRIQEQVNSGDYAVVIVDEEDGVVKQVKFDDNSIQLVSKNPYYPPRVFKGKEKNRIRIFGKVVESKRKFF